MPHDVVIVGAGIAGLRTGIETLRAYPHLQCIILEKYDYYGGRVTTYRTTLPGVGKIQFEKGAGRIATTHTKVLGLMKQYGLTTYPIHHDVGFMKKPGILLPNRFSELHDVFIEPLRQLPSELLQTHTLAQVSEMVFGSHATHDFYSQFPYFSEIYTLRADHAIYVFDYEMGKRGQFVGCAEGLSTLIDGMVHEFLTLGGSLLHQQEVRSIQTLSDGSVMVHTEHDSYHASLCVLALPSEAIKSIRGVSHLPVLDRLVMTPLLRMYAVFPLKKGKSWFSEIQKTVVDDPIRYIIPISDRSIMISYTDGNDARYWMRKNPAHLQAEVMKRIRSLFPDQTIPDPIFFKFFDWHNGCTYWKPGRYDLFEESKQSLHPDPIKMPRVFLCGESFAVLQCWMECAIEQADHMMNHPAFVRALKSISH